MSSLPRHYDISQIFASGTPLDPLPQHELDAAAMFKSRQPSRPMAPPKTSTPQSTPLNQQPSIPHHTTTTPPQSATSALTPAPPSAQTQPLASLYTSPSALSIPPAPRSQIEALPPSSTAPSPNHALRLHPALRHPVFFSGRLHKAPNGVWPGLSVSPVAAGYVVNDVVESEVVQARL